MGPRKDYKRARWLKWKYGLSPEAYALLIEAQGGCCALCKRPFSETDKGLQPVIDHSHISGKNRGILHKLCNMAIGLFHDDQSMCLLAAEYLRRYQD